MIPMDVRVKELVPLRALAAPPCERGQKIVTIVTEHVANRMSQDHAYIRAARARNCKRWHIAFGGYWQLRLPGDQTTKAARRSRRDMPAKLLVELFFIFEEPTRSIWLGGPDASAERLVNVYMTRCKFKLVPEQGVISREFLTKQIDLTTAMRTRRLEAVTIRKVPVAAHADQTTAAGILSV
jgi:hypothetical protein